MGTALVPSSLPARTPSPLLRGERARRIERIVDDPVPQTAPFTRSVAERGLGARAVDALIEALPVGLILVDRDGRVVYANGAARRLGGADAAPVLRRIARALLTGERSCGDAALDAPERVRAWVRLEVTPVRDERGAVTGAAATLLDVTAAHRMNEWAPVVESLMNL